MNRRGFLMFSASAAAIAAAPAVALAAPSVDVLTLEKLRQARRVLINEHFEDYYVCLVSAAQWEWLRSAEARQTWKHAHRTWRMSGKPGELEPRGILAAYANDRTTLAPAEVGVFEGFRFKVSSGPSIRAALPCASR